MYIFGYLFQKGHFQGSSKKKSTLTKSFGGGGTNDPPASPPAREGLNSFFSIWVFFVRHWQFTGHQGRERTIFIPLYHFHTFTNIQTLTYSFLISDDSFSITAYVITTLLLDKIYPPLDIQILFNTSFVLLVSDVSDTITAVSHNPALGWYLHRLSSYCY